MVAQCSSLGSSRPSQVALWPMVESILKSNFPGPLTLWPTLHGTVYHCQVSRKRSWRKMYWLLLWIPSLNHTFIYVPHTVLSLFLEVMCWCCDLHEHFLVWCFSNTCHSTRLCIKKLGNIVNASGSWVEGRWVCLLYRKTDVSFCEKGPGRYIGCSLMILGFPVLRIPQKWFKPTACVASRSISCWCAAGQWNSCDEDVYDVCCVMSHKMLRLWPGNLLSSAQIGKWLQATWSQFRMCVMLGFSYSWDYPWILFKTK